MTDRFVGGPCPSGLYSSKKTRQRPTLPPSCPGSTNGLVIFLRCSAKTGLVFTNYLTPMISRILRTAASGSKGGMACEILAEKVTLLTGSYSSNVP